MESSNKEEIFDILIKHILKIFDENNNEIKFSEIKIKETKLKYASNSSIHVYLDNNICLSSKETRKYRVLYKCRCGRENKILLCKYLLKRKIVCQHCLQDRTFEDHLDVQPYSIKKGLRSKINNNLNKQNNELIFENMNDEFKTNYYSNHLTNEEFFRYLPYMYQINNVIITPKNIKLIRYLEHYPTNNQFKFTAKVSFDNGITYKSIQNIKLQCSICKKIFNVHINNLKNKDLSNIKCKMCSLSNHRYNIKLFDESGLTYQSNPEKYFIEQCYKYNIKINNGLKIPYYFNNSNHIYNSDFYLPEYNYVIEIKSDNIWYRKDIESGKIKAKEQGVVEFGKLYNIKYKMLFDQDIDNFIKNILDERDSLNNQEID